MEHVTIEQVVGLLETRLNALGLSKEDIDINTSLLEQGILDSMSFLEFIIEIENEFHLELDFGELDPTEFTSIEKLRNLINNDH